MFSEWTARSHEGRGRVSNYHQLGNGTRSPGGPGNAVPDGELCAAQRLRLAGCGGKQQQRPFGVKTGGLFSASHHAYMARVNFSAILIESNKHPDRTGTTTTNLHRKES